MELNELLEIALKEHSQRKTVEIRCCIAAGCLSSHGQAVKDNLEASVKTAELQNTVQVTGVGCMRLCCFVLTLAAHMHTHTHIPPCKMVIAQTNWQNFPHHDMMFHNWTERK